MFIVGKMIRKSFKEMKLPRSSRVLELIHSDVCGPFEELTYDGYRYYVIFVDDYTHYTVGFLMKYKSESKKLFFESC